MTSPRPAVQIVGLFETHLTVANLDASVRFYEELLGLELAYRLQDRHVAFFWTGRRGGSMLGVWEAGTAPNTMRLHVAFACSLADLLIAPARLRERGVTPLGFYGEPAEEPVVIGWMPAASLYFRDPDGHLLEYVAMLDDAPRPGIGVVPYSAWIRIVSAS